MFHVDKADILQMFPSKTLARDSQRLDIRPILSLTPHQLYKQVKLTLNPEGVIGLGEFISQQINPSLGHDGSHLS